MKVQVLMSSYNGEKYIEEQIDSILEQKSVEVSLLIRDDGSKDATRAILKKRMKKDVRITCVFEENIGVKRSFLKLVQMADPACNYYAFSDQDDIWMKDKLSAAIAMLGTKSSDIPLIYGSAVLLYANGEVIGEQFVCSQLDLGNFLIKNYYPGCTMVFNKKLKEFVDMVDYNLLRPNPLHDHWLNLICTTCGGKVLMDSKPHIFYRQHMGNVVGDRSLIQKIMGNGLVAHSDNARWKICDELHRIYGDYESDKASKLIETVLASKKGFRNKLKLAFSKDIKPVATIEKIAIFMISILGKF